MEPLTEIDVSAFGLTPLHERDPTGAPLLSEVEGETLVSFYPDISLVLGKSLDQGSGNFYVTSRWVCRQVAQEVSVRRLGSTHNDQLALKSFVFVEGGLYG